MSKTAFVMLRIGVSSTRPRFWAAARETIIDRYQLHEYFDRNIEKSHRIIFQYETVPAWFWARYAEKQMLNDEEDGAEGWIELTQEEFEKYSDE